MLYPIYSCLTYKSVPDTPAHMSNNLEAAAAWASSGKIPTTQAEVETLKSLCKAVNGLLLKLRRLKNAPSAKRASARWSIEEDAELRDGFVKGGRVGAVAALAGRRSVEACLSHLNKVLLPSVMYEQTFPLGVLCARSHNHGLAARQV